MLRLKNSSFFIVLLIMAIVVGLPYFVEAKVWKIALLRTDAPYAVEQEDALRKILKKQGLIAGRKVEVLPTKIVATTVEEFGETAVYVKGLIAQKPDLIATIGTQASVPVWLIVEKSGIPMVFAGVTYPVEGNLIEAFGKPTGKNITGIGYAIPAKERIAIIRKIFPDTKRFRRMAFIYSGQVPQEFAYTKELKKLGTTTGWEFIFIDCFDSVQQSPSYKLLIKKLKEADPDIAFGWYSFDQLGADRTSFKKMTDDFRKPFVPGTTKPMEYGGVASVVTDHFDLAQKQAKMIQDILQGEFAGKIPPVEPTKYKIELNLNKAKELDIQFDPAVLKAASRVIK